MNGELYFDEQKKSLNIIYFSHFPRISHITIVDKEAKYMSKSLYSFFVIKINTEYVLV